MIVMTIDQRKSRRNPDLVDQLVERLSHVPCLRPFERTAGDEVQGVLESAETAVQVALDLAETREWSVGIGVGAVELPLPTQTRAGRGHAFEQAREAVERAKSSPGHIALAAHRGGGEAARLEAELQLMGAIVARRTPTSIEAGRLTRQGMSQKEAAARLGITQQAVSSRLTHALWNEVEGLKEHAIHALMDIDDAQASQTTGGEAA